MPLLKITAADIQKNKTVESDWYGLEITKVSDLVKSKAGDSVNCVVTFLVEGTEGKEIDRTYNSKAIGMIIPLIEAIRGKKVEAKDFNFDTDELKGKKVDGKLVVEIYENRPINKIENFLPYGKGKGQATPF